MAAAQGLLHTLQRLVLHTLDVDLYEPTKAAIEHLLPRMPRGSILAFDQLDNPIWPGEARAVLDTLGIRNIEMKRFEWDPYVAYAIM